MEIIELIKGLEGRKKITEKVLDQLCRLDTIISEEVIDSDVEVEVNGIRVGIGTFSDWVGTMKVQYRHLYIIDDEDIKRVIPKKRERIGGTACNMTNMLSRTWYFMTREQIRFLLGNLRTIITKLLEEANKIEEFPVDDIRKLL